MTEHGKPTAQYLHGGRNDDCVLCFTNAVLDERLLRGVLAHQSRHYQQYEACNSHSIDDLKQKARKITALWNSLSERPSEEFAPFISREGKLIAGKEDDPRREYLPSKLPSRATIHIARFPVIKEDLLLGLTCEVTEALLKVGIAWYSLENAWDALHMLAGEETELCVDRRQLIDTSLDVVVSNAKALLQMTSESRAKKQE